MYVVPVLAQRGVERTRVGDPSRIVWVARDTDSLGWDVEDRSRTPHRRIEVKGRRDAEIIFFLSENECSKAQQLGADYEVHFWGEINLNLEPAVEYAALRAAGYPVVIENLAARLAKGDFVAEPVRWRLRRSAS